MSTDAREAMFAKRAEVMAEHQHLTTAAEVAPLMGEHEREYWTWCVERALQANTYVRKPAGSSSVQGEEKK
jgi:methylaspartate ammonia-lyase